MQADHLRMQAGRHRTRLGDFSHATNNPTRGSSIARSSRHPDLVNLAPVVVQPRRDIEADQRYRRTDMSSLHAYTARWRFAHNIAQGEAGMRLAEAALLVAAEDDAIASHSTVPFPVESYLARIQKLADEFKQQRLQPLRERAAQQQQQRSQGGGDGSPSGQGAASGVTTPGVTAQDVIDELHDYLFRGQRFVAPPFGRSNLPRNTMLDHPGVWEDARWGYLNELLIRRKGHSAALAILVSEVMRRLLSSGSLDFAVAMDVRGFMGLPQPVVLHGISREMLVHPSSLAQQQQQEESSGATSGSDSIVVLNTCTSDTLAELLRHLKRSYWPLPWDTSVDKYEEEGRGSHGGFRPGAKAAIGEEMSAQLRAISTVANWRLERGVWTSPGAGDIRRCRAACERLVLLGGESEDEERRDLAVILLHSGELAAARAELAAYMDTSHFRVTADGMDRALCRQMWQSLSGVPGIQDASALTLDGTLAGPSPEEAEFHDRKMPLTW